MPARTLFKEWWVILLQGVFMIALSIIIFNNPGPVIAAVALWLGVVVILTGLVGTIAWFSAAKQDREILSLLASIVILIIGVLMITKMVVTIKAITIVFGLIVAFIGWVLLSAGWNSRKEWPGWWFIALLGVATLVMGIKSIFDIYSGAENISNFIGIAVLLSGLGLIVLAFLKKKLVNKIRHGINKLRREL
jgi:uncharacterized membrane protein HdeD (DUF308 family)